MLMTYFSNLLPCRFELGVSLIL